ncbi:MAG: M23 family metallopeptidase [Gemmatimonadota bacterium]|nr:M23 family metallopeptidase [Gemmatimonadota bacterium]
MSHRSSSRLRRAVPLLIVTAALAGVRPTAAAAQTLELVFHPADSIFLYEVEPSQGLWSAVVQNVAIINRGAEPVELASLTIEAVTPDGSSTARTVPASYLAQSAARLHGLEAAGLLDLYDFHFQTSRLLSGDARIASSATVAPGEGLIVSGQPILVGAPRGRLTVSVAGRSERGGAVTGSAEIPIAVATPEIVVRSPVRGVWYVAAAPTFDAHHRWAAPQEFAFDLVVLGEDAEMSAGDGLRSTDYHAYGRTVHAVAAGVVVDAESDAIEDEGRYRQPGETAEEWQGRTIAAQNELLAEGPRTVSGNFVVIRHADGTYSNYIHLREGSVQVAIGDSVSAGQVIGEVGQTGNSDAPHLHFQVVDGPDPLYSRGLPVRFSDVEVVGFGWRDRYLRTGWFFKTDDDS